MSKKKANHITVFEHQSIKIGQTIDGTMFSELHQKKFEHFFGDKGVPYFKLINKGIAFKEYVGVILVGSLTVEVLPKADKHEAENKTKWRSILIGMLRAVNQFDIHAPSSTALKLKTNSILDLYFELFIKEVEYLFNKGLIKKYRKTESNSFALKGNILFRKHIQENLIHKERFYIQHTTYDNQHLIHQILYKTLRVLKRINVNVVLNSRIGNLLLNFPELKDVKVTEATFNKINFNRKTDPYKNAIEIARLLLLSYHPDLSSGQNNVLALMFDMNLLWERFIYVSLRKYLAKNLTITAQTSKHFWKPDNGCNSNIRPDIVINKDKEGTVVIDTKWKNIGSNNPSSDDLRQLYVYHKYYDANKVALLYPGNSSIKQGNYFEIDNKTISSMECSIIRIDANPIISDWQKEIAKQVYGKWLIDSNKVTVQN